MYGEDNEDELLENPDDLVFIEIADLEDLKRLE
jgi:hypothetical protein